MTKDEAQNFLRATWRSQWNFCNCGGPEETMRYIGRVLDEKMAIFQGGEKQPMSTDERWAEHKKLLPFDSDRAWLVHYFLDSQGLTEHGGGVGGAWLTGKGRRLLEAIKLAGDEEWSNE